MQNALRGQLASVQRTPVQAIRFALRFVGRLGFGRQSALAATRRMFPMRAISPARQALSLFVGSTLIGVGVGLLTQARLGLSPYDVLVSALVPRIGLSFGQTVIVVSAVLFLIAAALGKRPSRWGVAYVLANGVAIDAVSSSINAPESMVARVLFVVASLAALGSGISLVVHSGSTGGAFELLMAAGEERGYDRRRVRTSLEVGILTAGIVLGGSFGPATVAVALSIGPILGCMGQALADYSYGRSLRLLEASPEARHPSAATRQR
jgi:uncharacterized membrane protein YczE